MAPRSRSKSTPAAASAATSPASRPRREPHVDRRPELRRRPSCSALGRRHTPTDIAGTVSDSARDAGFASVCLDLLYDVPGQTIASWRDTLDGTLALEPDHVSAYALTLDDHEPERRPPRAHAAAPRSGAREPASNRTRTAPPHMYELADDALARAGLHLVRDLELVATRARKPAQQRLLVGRRVGGRRPRRARLRRSQRRVAGTRPT